MVSLARSSLIYEWRRFLAAILAVAFSGLLVLVQLALLLGMFGTVSVYIDASDADLWVGYRDTQSVDLGRNIPQANAVFIHLHPEVVAVEPMLWTGGDWRKPGGGAITTFVVGIDTRPHAMGLARAIPPALRERLLEPMSVIVDEADRAKLGVDVGDAVEINRKRVRVVGTTTGLRAIGGVNVVTSLSTARQIDGLNRQAAEEVTYFLVKLRDPAQAERVRAELEPTGSRKPYSVFVAHDFSVRSQSYWLFESGAGAGFGFSSLLGLAVGVAITSQTLMAAILASIREYATLRALGVPARSLAAVVLEQSGWVGVIGLFITALATAGVAWLAHVNYVAMTFPWWSLVLTAVMVIVIALGSGLLALRSLFRAEPATLLR